MCISNKQDVQSAAANVEQCVDAIDHWMAANRLRLNPEKTELIRVGSKHSLLKVFGSGPSLMLGAVNINAADVVRVLGVLLTPDLSLDKHITALSVKCFLQRVSIACYAERCISHSKSVRLSV